MVEIQDYGPDKADNGKIVLILPGVQEREIERKEAPDARVSKDAYQLPALFPLLLW